MSGLYSRESAAANARAVLSAVLRGEGHLPAWCGGSVECPRCGRTGAIELAEHERRHGATAYQVSKRGEIFVHACAT